MSRSQKFTVVIRHSSCAHAACLDDSFVYRLVNRVLRTGNPDLIHPYRFFINDLYDELMSIDREYLEDFDELIVYRGQCLTEPEIRYLQSHVGQLLSLSSFTSTTMDRDLAVLFAGCRENMISVLFEIHLGITVDNTQPFAYLGVYSAIPDELEVLISMGTIFKLVSLNYDSNSTMWTITLELCRQHNRDIKNIAALRDYKSMGLSRFKAIPFRRSSMSAVNRFDANLEQFNLSYNWSSKKIEKATSLPTTTKNDMDRRIRHTSSLRSQHDLSASFIKINMKLFQERQQERKAKLSISCPCLPSFNRLIIQRPYSLPVLPTRIMNRFCFPINNPPFSFKEAGSNDSSVDGLFAAGIYDTLMVANYVAEDELDNSSSLKEQADELRHDLRKIFNLEKGKWCSEY